MKNLFPNIICIALFSFMTCVLNAHGLSISGKITFNGAPVRGILVYGSDGLKKATTNRDGIYTIKVTTAGTYTISPLPRRFYLPTPFSKTVTIGASDITDVNFELQKFNAEKGVIAGRIATTKNIPLEGVKVRISKTQSATTDKNGIYFIHDLTPGRYIIVPSVDGYTFSASYKEFKLNAGKTFVKKFAGYQRLSGDTYSTYFSGPWNIDVKTSKNTCLFITQQSLSGKTLIGQKKSSLSVRLPTIGTLRGIAASNAFSIDVKIGRFACKVTGDVDASFPNQDKGNITGKLNLNCFFSTPCDIEFTATLDRIG